MPPQSTIKPFARGDVLAGATLLNNASDDHAGAGRIMQFDADLNEKGVLWTQGTTHLVGGLAFGPDGNLWAFDSNSHAILRVRPDGKQLPKIDFPKRAFSNVTFGPDDSIYLAEHLVGDKINLPPDRPLHTTLARLPGSQMFGYGHVYRCDMSGKLIQEYETEVHGGMPGFLGVTSSTLARDGTTLIYLSELGTRVFRYDLKEDRQLPDLIRFSPESGDLAMHVKHSANGNIFLIKANFRTGTVLQNLDESGQVLRQYALADRGWASIAPSIDDQFVFLGNFLTGRVAKFDLAAAEFVANGETHVQRSLAGIAQYAGH